MKNATLAAESFLISFQSTAELKSHKSSAKESPSRINNRDMTYAFLINNS